MSDCLISQGRTLAEKFGLHHTSNLSHFLHPRWNLFSPTI